MPRYPSGAPLHRAHLLRNVSGLRARGQPFLLDHVVAPCFARADSSRRPRPVRGGSEQWRMKPTRQQSQFAGPPPSCGASPPRTNHRLLVARCWSGHQLFPPARSTVPRTANAGSDDDVNRSLETSSPTSSSAAQARRFREHVELRDQALHAIRHTLRAIRWIAPQPWIWLEQITQDLVSSACLLDRGYCAQEGPRRLSRLPCVAGSAAGRQLILSRRPNGARARAVSPSGPLHPLR